MLILSTILILVYLFICRQIKDPLLKKIIKFLVVLYGTQICLAIWDPYNVYKVNLTTIFLFHVQIVFLIVGVFSCKRTKKIKLQSNAGFKWPTIEINIFMLIVITILFLYSYYNYNRMQSFLLNMASMTNEGREYYYTMFFPSYTMKVIDMFITSFKYVAFFSSIALLLTKGLNLRIKEYYFIALTLFSYAFQLLTAQSRLDIFVIVLMLILLAYVSKIYETKNYKQIVLPFMIITGIGVAAFFFSVTLLRTNLSSDEIDGSLIDQLIIEPFVSYFYVPVLGFDYARGSLLNYGFPMCGLATFSAVVDAILLPLTYLDHSFGALSMNTLLGNTIGTGMYFPSGKHWMAMYTGCANYYLDFWYLGFVIFPILHGWLMAKLVYSFKTSAASFMVLTFMFYVSFRHATACGIQSIDTLFFMLWVYVTIKSKSVSYIE